MSSPWRFIETAREFDILPASAVAMRVRYLEQQVAEYEQIGDELADRYAGELREEIRQLQEILATVERKPEILEKQQRVPEHVVELARAVPFDRLIEFDRTGKALAPCHDDRTPSLTWWKKGNVVTCWPCDKRWDTIQWVMERQGISFREAVRQLTGRVE